MSRIHLYWVILFDYCITLMMMFLGWHVFYFWFNHDTVMVQTAAVGPLLFHYSLASCTVAYMLYSLVTAVSFACSLPLLFCVALMQMDCFSDYTWVESSLNAWVWPCVRLWIFIVYIITVVARPCTQAWTAATRYWFYWYFFCFWCVDLLCNACCSGEAVHACVYCSPTRIVILIDISIVWTVSFIQFNMIWIIFWLV